MAQLENSVHIALAREAERLANELRLITELRSDLPKRAAILPNRLDYQGARRWATLLRSLHRLGNCENSNGRPPVYLMYII